MKKSGIEIIAEERQRHFTVEGWTLENDLIYVNGQLSDAAVCYAMNAEDRELVIDMFYTKLKWKFWPFNSKYWKPTPNDRIRELAKAGALIAAEIDRLQYSED